MNKEPIIFLLMLIFSLSFVSFFFSCGNDGKNYSLKDYKNFVSNLNDGDYYSIGRAAEKFRENFDRNFAEKNDSAFITFREHYYSVINTGNVIFWQNEEFQSQFYENTSAYSEDAEKFLDSLQNNGLRLSASEGLFFIDEDPDYLFSKFSDFLSPSLSNYLRIRKEELKEGYAEDAGLLISYDQLGERIADWENYVEKYPNSLLKEEAEFNYNLYLNTFLTGMDNSPIWNEEGTLSEKIKKTYRNFIEKSEGKASGQLVQKFYSFLEERNFKYSEEVFGFYDKNLPDLMFNDLSPIN